MRPATTHAAAIPAATEPRHRPPSIALQYRTTAAASGIPPCRHAASRAPDRSLPLRVRITPVERSWRAHQIRGAVTPNFVLQLPVRLSGSQGDRTVRLL